MTPEPRSAAQEWSAHWPFVLAAMTGFSFFAVVTYSLGTFMQPLEEAFGWSRSELSFGLTIFGFIQALGGPVVGAMLDRIGTRRLVLVGMPLSGAAFAGFGLADGSLAQWYALWALFGICALSIKSTVWSAATSGIFSASRGLALAAVLSGSAIGQSLAPIVANALIARHGWSRAYAGIGIGWAGLAFVLAVLFFFDARGRRGPGPAPSGGAQPVPPVLPGLGFGEAFRDARILRIAIANLMMALVGSGVTVHLVPLITESGLVRSSAVEMAAWAGIAGIAGKFVAGWLLDRHQGSLVPFTSFFVAAIGHFLLLDLFGSRALLTLGVILLGYSAGAGLQVTTYLVSRYAGLRNFGAIFGMISSMMMLGAALGPPLAGFVHDRTGSYAALLAIAIPVMALSAGLFVRLGAYPAFAAPAAATPAN